MIGGIQVNLSGGHKLGRSQGPSRQHGVAFGGPLGQRQGLWRFQGQLGLHRLGALAVAAWFDAVAGDEVIAPLLAVVNDFGLHGAFPHLPDGLAPAHGGQALWNKYSTGQALLTVLLTDDLAVAVVVPARPAAARDSALPFVARG